MEISHLCHVITVVAEVSLNEHETTN